MGTRHLIAVFIDGEYKVSQYCQWDGYIEGAGVKILQFLRDDMTPAFRDNVRACRWVSQEESASRLRKFGIDPNANFAPAKNIKRHDVAFPEVSRDAGANILDMIQKKPRGLTDMLDFAGDSLFCEFAYVVDLDANVFEIYTGFNKKPLEKGERFFGFEHRESIEAIPEYFPVKLFKRFSLDVLPSDTVFIELCEDNDDDDADDEAIGP